MYRCCRTEATYLQKVWFSGGKKGMLFLQVFKGPEVMKLTQHIIDFVNCSLSTREKNSQIAVARGFSLHDCRTVQFSAPYLLLWTRTWTHTSSSYRQQTQRTCSMGQFLKVKGKRCFMLYKIRLNSPASVWSMTTICLCSSLWKWNDLYVNL